MTAVWKHELRSCVHSLSAWLYCAFMLAFVGVGAMLYNIQAAVANFEYVLSFVCIGLVFIVPVLTMRSLAEERKQKTDQLLYSLPLKLWHIITGKYLALLAVFLVPLVIIAFYPLVFSQYGEVYLLTSYGSLLAFFLLGAALIAIGMFISSLTENQGFAAGIGIVALLLNYYSVSLAEQVSATALGSFAVLLVLALLLGVLALVCGAVFLVSRVQQHQEAIRSGTTTVLTLDTSTATALSWEYADNSFSFHKDDQWIYDADNAFPVDQVEIGTLLGQFEQFTADFTIEDAQNLSQYGLDDPTCTIHIETTDGGYDILLGDYSQMDQQRYVSIGDGNVYLASSDPLDVYNVLLAGLIQNDETPDFDGVTAIRFTGADNYTATYEENNSSTYSTDDVYFTKLGSQSLALDTTR